MVERLSSQDDPSTKLATFELKRLISDPIFRNEFIARGGLVEITSLIERASGNTLAYSLEAMAVLMESSSSWDGLDVVFITRVSPPRSILTRLDCLYTDRQHLCYPATNQHQPTCDPHTCSISSVRPQSCTRIRREKSSPAFYLCLWSWCPLAHYTTYTRILYRST